MNDRSQLIGRNKGHKVNIASEVIFHGIGDSLKSSTYLLKLLDAIIPRRQFVALTALAILASCSCTCVAFNFN